jgi:hypothetical protein
MKNNIDLWAVGVGVVGSFMKGIKHKLNIKELCLGMVVAGILAFSTIGILDLLFSDLEPRIIILVSFAVGWVANELTDVLDVVVKDAYALFHQWLKNRFKVNKKDNDKIN